MNQYTRLPFVPVSEKTSSASCSCCSNTASLRSGTTTAINPSESKTVRGKWNAISSSLLGIGIAFFPKCPICWAAYASALGVFGIETISYQAWMLPVMIVLLLVNVFVLTYMSKRHTGFGPGLLSIIGIVFILSSKILFDIDSFVYIGLVMIIMGALWNALPGTDKSFAKLLRPIFSSRIFEIKSNKG